MTACKYGRAWALELVIEAYDGNVVRISEVRVESVVGRLQRWNVVAARKVATVSPPAILRGMKEWLAETRK